MDCQNMLVERAGIGAIAFCGSANGVYDLSFKSPGGPVRIAPVMDYLVELEDYEDPSAPIAQIGYSFQKYAPHSTPMYKEISVEEGLRELRDQYSDRKWLAWREYVESDLRSRQAYLEEEGDSGFSDEVLRLMEEMENFMEFSPSLDRQRVAFFAGFTAALKS